MIKTEVDKLIERVREARASGRLIVFVKTDEMQVVSDFIKQQDLIMVDCKRTEGGKATLPSVRYVLPDFTLKDEGIYPSVIDCPTLFVLMLGERGEKQTQDQQALYGKLYRFVQLYTRAGLAQVEDAAGQYGDTLKWIDRSLILIFTPQTPEIPASLALYSEYIPLRPPQGEELYVYLSGLVGEIDGDNPALHAVPGAHYRLFIDTLCSQFRGMSCTKIRQILLKFKNKYDRVYLDLSENDDHEAHNPKDKRMFEEDMRRLIRKEKEQLIATSSILQLKEPGGKKAAGMAKLNRYVEERSDLVKKSLHNEQTWRLNAPKGVLVTGVPGSGKSLMAKWTAHQMGLPLIKMDMGDVQNKYVGSSEQRMTESLELVNAMSPCVLWIDEIEKSFAGSSGNGNSNEVTVRLFGKFLNWMQEKEDDGVCCFVFATANNIDKLPPELFRSGRFDAKFSTFMPTADECGEIFDSLLDKLCKDYEESPYGEQRGKKLFDRERVNKKMLIERFLNGPLCLEDKLEASEKRVTRRNKFFTGSDIENLVKSAQERYVLRYGNKRGQHTEYDTDTFIRCMEEVLPDIRTYGETNLDDVATSFAIMAHNNLLPASYATLLPHDKGQYDEYRPDVLYQMEDETRHLEQMCAYDQCLYLAVRNVLNAERKRILEKIEIMMKNK